MARHRTVAVANHVAYDLGYKGVTISSALLENQVRQPDEVEWRRRKGVLEDRVKSVNQHHWTIVVIGSVVFFLALFVDYAIIHEFWTRMLSNEFGEVPASMANTVAAKSMQVLFATLSIHYLISHMHKHVRAIYSGLVFLVAFAMLLGIGLLWANNNLPEEAKVFASPGSETTRTLDQFSKNLGVEPPKKAPVSSVVKVLRKYEAAIRLLSLSVIFIIVSSIGAISLDSAIRGFSAWSGGAVYDTHHEAVTGRRLNAEYSSFKAEDEATDWREGDGSNEDDEVAASPRSLNGRVGEFVSSYTAGVVDADHSANETNRLLASVTNAANELLGIPSRSAA